MIRRLLKNWPVKIICLCAASLLWFYIFAQQNTLAKFPGEIPINTINVSSNLVATLDLKSTKVTALGKQSDWRRLTSDSFNVYLDLNGLTAGVYQLPLTALSRVNGISVVSTNPNKIVVRLEPITTKIVPVTKKIEGDAADGLIAGDVSFEPAEVRVRGPESALTTLTEVFANIQLNGEEKDFNQNILIEALDDRGQIIPNVEIIPVETKARVALVKGSNVKTIGVAPHILGVLRDDYFVSGIKTTPSVIEVTGDRNTLKSLEYLETQTIDLSGVSQNVTYDVSLNLPIGVTAIMLNDAKVHVEISISHTEITRDLVVQNIKFLNEGDLIVDSYDPAQVTITCQGSAAVINALHSSDFTLNINLYGKQPGQSYSIPLTPDMVSVPEAVLVRALVTTSISLKIR